MIDIGGMTIPTARDLKTRLSGLFHDLDFIEMA